MFPLRDDIPSRTTPWVNYGVIALCTLAFLAQLGSGEGGQEIVEQFGMVPLRLSDPDATPVIEQPVPVATPRGLQVQVVRRELAPPVIPPWLTVVTCMFLHGGWLHFLGNMWFLYIFGDNVEDRVGHTGFAALYLGTGIAAGLAHYVTSMNSPIPTVGASGAIAGVMGAYALLYPHARVLAAIPIVIVLYTFVVPAPVFLAIWFVIQTVSGIGSLTGGAAGGVAWWAHIGGFVAGAAIAWVIGKTPAGHPAVTERRF